LNPEAICYLIDFINKMMVEAAGVEPESEIRSPSDRRKDRIDKSVFKSEKG